MPCPIRLSDTTGLLSGRACLALRARYGINRAAPIDAIEAGDVVSQVYLPSARNALDFSRSARVAVDFALG